jgi:SAM-dependent methyltransferase
VWPFPADFIERVDNPMSPEAEVVTEECVNKVVTHQRLFLKDGQAVLELVSEPVSLLPGELRYSSKEMLVINEEMITSKEIALSYPDNSFDAVSITSGVQYFIEPKDIFREVWRVLKPEGRCFVSFLTKFPASELKPTRMWTTMNDEQKIWIVGSYFHYAADEGWSSIEGYDLFSSDTKELVFEKNNNVNAYVVQAVKSALPSVEESPASYVAQKLSACKNMEPEDRKYIVSLLSH